MGKIVTYIIIAVGVLAVLGLIRRFRRGRGSQRRGSHGHDRGGRGEIGRLPSPRGGGGSERGDSRTGWRDLDTSGGDGIEIDRRGGGDAGGWPGPGETGGGTERPDNRNGWRELETGGGDGIEIDGPRDGIARPGPDRSGEGWQELEPESGGSERRAPGRRGDSIDRDLDVRIDGAGPEGIDPDFNYQDAEGADGGDGTSWSDHEGSGAQGDGWTEPGAEAEDDGIEHDLPDRSKNR